MKIVQDTTFTSATAVPLTFTFDQTRAYHFLLHMAAGTDADVFALLELSDSHEGGGSHYGFQLSEVEPVGATSAGSLVVASARNYSPAYGKATLWPRFEGAALFQGMGRSPQSVAAGNYVAAMVTGLTDINYDGGQITITLARSGRLIVYEERITT